MADDNGNGQLIDRKIWYTGLDEIAGAIGYNKKIVYKLIEVESLPAFKFYGKWAARKEDINTWSKNIAKKYRPGSQIKTRRTRRRVSKISVL